MNSHAGEQEIVWLEDRNAYPYLREMEYTFPTRSCKPKVNRLVAYAVLAPGTQRHSQAGFLRRYWYVLPHDPYPGGPIEGVDPASVFPGVPTMKTIDSITDWLKKQRAGGAKPL